MSNILNVQLYVFYRQRPKDGAQADLAFQSIDPFKWCAEMKKVLSKRCSLVRFPCSQDKMVVWKTWYAGAGASANEPVTEVLAACCLRTIKAMVFLQATKNIRFPDKMLALQRLPYCMQMRGCRLLV